MIGIGDGLTHLQPLNVAMGWFPEKKGLVVGIIESGYGLSAFVFDQIQTAYINPDNVMIGDDGYWDNDEVLDRVPTIFVILGGVYLALQMVALTLITPPPPSLSDDYNLSSSRPLVESTTDGENIKPSQIVKTLSLIHI